MTYNCFDDSQKSPILVDAEVGGTIFSLSAGVYSKEILSIFPSKCVYFGWTFKQNQCFRSWEGLGAKSVTIHP